MTQDPLFDRGEDYAAMLENGLRLTGESADFFRRGRLSLLTGVLAGRVHPTRILDFGCGTGETTLELSGAFPGAEVVGIDSAAGALRVACKHERPGSVSFAHTDQMETIGTFDLCYANGVFHHIPAHRRPTVLRQLRKLLRPDAVLSLFENNPWNPGTRWVMSRIPFDRDAEMLSAPAVRRLLASTGWVPLRNTIYLFFFPRRLSALRPLERHLQRLPFGGQYLVLASVGTEARRIR